MDDADEADTGSPDEDLCKRHICLQDCGLRTVILSHYVWCGNFQAMQGW